MRKKPGDPFHGLTSIDDIHARLGLTQQKRCLDDMHGAASAFNRQPADFAASLTGPHWAREAGRLARSEVDAFQFASGHRYLDDAVKKSRLAGLSALNDLTKSISISEMLASQSHLTHAFDWGRMIGVNALADYAGANYMSDSATAAMEAAYALPDSLQFAEQMVQRANAFLPKSYIGQFQTVIGGIDFEAIRSVAEAATSDINRDHSPEDLDSLDDVYNIVDRAHLDEVGAAVAQAVSAAISEAAEKGLLGGGPSQWTILFVQMVFMLLLAVSQIVGGPIFQHLYEKREARFASGPEPKKLARQESHRSVRIERDIRKPGFTGSAGSLLVPVRALHLLLGPDTKQRVVAIIPPGQLLRKRRTQRDWILVKYTDHQGDGVSMTGWVRSKYVRSVEAETQRIILCALTAGTAEQENCDN